MSGPSEGEEIYPDDEPGQWAYRGRKLLKSIEGDRDYFLREANIARQRYRALGLTTLVCSVLAPLTVVSSTSTWTGGSTSFTSAMAGLAILFSVVLAFAEGIRRMYRPNERWTACYLRAEALRVARDNYRFKQMGKTLGSSEWIANLDELRRILDSIRASDNDEFFAAIRVDSQPPPPAPAKLQ